MGVEKSGTDNFCINWGYANQWRETGFMRKGKRNFYRGINPLKDKNLFFKIPKESLREAAGRDQSVLFLRG